MLIVVRGDMDVQRQYMCDSNIIDGRNLRWSRGVAQSVLRHLEIGEASILYFGEVSVQNSCYSYGSMHRQYTQYVNSDEGRKR